jgi:hypothetical protein
MGRRIGALAWAGASAVTVLSLGACERVPDVPNPVDDSTEESYEVAVPISTVVVDARTAKVTITAGDGPIAVTETRRFSGPEPQTDRIVDGQTLRLTETGCGEGVQVRCDVEYQIRLPGQTGTQVLTRAGDVSVSGVGGPLTVTTDAGLVRADGLTSDTVDVATKAGLVSLTFAEAPALVQTQTDVGAIEVRVPGDQRYAVDVSADLGASSVTVERDAGAAHRISARTRAGAVKVAPA